MFKNTPVTLGRYLAANGQSHKKKNKKKIETPFAPFPLETFYCLSYSLPILKWYDLKLLVEQFQKRRDLETASATIVGVFKTGQENRSGVKETEPCPQLVQ